MSFLYRIINIFIAASAFAAESYYTAPRSYSTTRDPDLPKYAQKGVLKEAAWLDLGLDYRFRYEYRDDDIRRAQGGLDDLMLHRTRAYMGVHDVIDPLRFAVEMQDARRYGSAYPRDNRDVNEFEFTRLYVELYFKSALGHDLRGNPRPLSLRYGIHNFELLDRRLIGNNQWRNTANAFQGFTASLGQEANDWQIDLLAVQPLARSLYDWDRPVEQMWMYAAIGHWRGFGPELTLEPFYLGLHQSAYAGVQERSVHSPGLRAYGVLEGGFDYDFSYTQQFGSNGPRSIRAWAATAEVGYSWAHAWKPRVSLFYGHATGDHDPTDGTDNRFERFYGFGRPWSANEYIVYENIRTPKLRVELTPRKYLRIDFGYSAYWLESATDRFPGARNARDLTGASGSSLGQELDIRARWQVNQQIEATLGYAHFMPGSFVETNVRRGDSDFAYLEISIRGF
ncbi:MAG: alginate export family protein [Verrucomicrobiaceae bacterium]|nr:alginate export family protein [Verrucomicrobiaceae bacterium]